MANPGKPPDAHARAPDVFKSLYKKYQKAGKDAPSDLVDCLHSSHLVRPRIAAVPQTLRDMFAEFTGECPNDEMIDPLTVYDVTPVPGLSIYPNLLPPSVQITLLNKLLHRDLSDPVHQTNIHLHYNVQYPSSQSNGPPISFFDPLAANLDYSPKATHAAINTRKFLDKKLRWITLGGQYDWTNKVYPSGQPPPFPADIKQLVETLFPMKAEAAICNLYSPGDTLSLHRDVSEECACPLVSISLGCEAIFVVGLEEPDAKGQTRVAAIKLRSGDAVLMSGESRYAWHGVPKVLPETCPQWLQDWPNIGADDEKDGRYKAYSGWMNGKRINLNVRQMFASEPSMAAPVEEPGDLENGS